MIEALGSAYTVVMVVLFLGLSIFVHELGHYVAARACGMVVDVFSIGLGPALWKRKRGATTYKIGAIPFGGYVALPQLDPSGMEKIQGSNGTGTGEPRKLPFAKPWKRMIVSVSGATGNILFAVLIAWLVYWIGIPITAAQRSAQVGFVEEGSDAWQQGLRVGDTVRCANGNPVRNWQQVLTEAALHNAVVLDAVSPKGEPRHATLKTEPGPMEQKTLKSIYGISLCRIDGVEPGRSADRAGLKKGDLVLEFGGVRIISGDQLIDLVSGNQGKAMTMKVRRDNADLDVTVTPEYDATAKRARIGVKFDPFIIAFDEGSHPKPSEQLYDHATLIVRVLQALVTPKQSANAAKAVGGPVAILETYYRIVTSSLMLAVWFTGLLNVNLAMINLLPIPVLDGGLLMFCLWEWVTRRALPPRVISVLVNVFAALIIGLFVIISYRDVRRSVPPDTWVGRGFTRVDRLLGGEAAPLSTNGAPVAAAVTTNAPASTNQPPR